ncbi:MAG: FtsX-like permease family protein [Clostridiaceae bacterium]|nr:FtsX-like permease family protein [Clostridiaceae bacterium]
MILLELFKQAFDSLKSNKMRSFLTMLGIVMGVFSVIAIMALGNATENYIVGEFEKIGANTYNIYNKGSDITQNEWLTLKDINLLEENIPEIKNITTLDQGFGQLRVDSDTRDAMISGVTSQYRNFAVVDLVAGRFISSFDDTARAKVAVVDESFAKRYFNRVDIVGEELSLRLGRYNIKVKVVGVLGMENDFLTEMAGDQMPAIVFMPIKTIQSITGNERLSTIMFSIYPEADVKMVTDKIIGLLERTHRSEDCFYLQSMDDVQKMFSSVIGVITSVLLVIAVITLIVGGIGIINILLVSVTERIREIGIRKALGAKKRDIVIQFLLESILMTGIAGMVGIFLGVLNGNVISSVIYIPPAVDVQTIILSFTISVALGLIFGVYPAKKAADLDPIEALRYE